ncbi:MAG: PAS domain S-box protein, partial [Spirochaetaceae bacterium]
EPFVVVSLEDITELKDTERALEESRSEYEECYRDLPVMLHSLDAAARILDVNSEWLLTLGYAREEVVGRKSVEFLTPESRRFAMQQALPEFFRKGRARDVPYRFRRKDGGPVDVLLSAMAQHDRRGAFVRSVVVSLKSANAAAIRTQTVS